MGKNKSSKLKSHKAAKAWKMIKAGECYKDIAEAVGHTTTAIKLYARRKFKDESEKLWAAEIKETGVCEISNRTYDLHAHHILEKSVWPHLSRDLSNGICLNAEYHEFNPEISPHATLASGEEFLRWLKENRPGQYAFYQEHKHDRKYQDPDYEAAYYELKGE